jgi:CheY-like chemotaxis protein
VDAARRPDDLGSGPRAGPLAFARETGRRPSGEAGILESKVDTPNTADDSDKAQVTVLVVDDDPLIAMSTADMLEDLGHHVLDAHSGAQAVEILQSGVRVDVIVTDHAMPGMNGAEFAARARALRPGIPILLTTGYAHLPLGDDLTLPRLAKPYQQRDLAEKLAELLARPAQ